MPSPPISRLYLHEGVFTALIPDELRDQARTLDLDAIRVRRERVERVRHLAEVVAELCGAAAVRDLPVRYEELYGERVDLAGLVDDLLVLQRRMGSYPTFELWLNREAPGYEDADDKTPFAYVIHYSLGDAEIGEDMYEDVLADLGKDGEKVERDRVEGVLDDLERRIVRERDQRDKMLRGLIEAHAQKAAYGPVPLDASLAKGEVYDWKCRLPEVVNLRGWLDAHVPDDEDDCLYADYVIEQLLERLAIQAGKKVKNFPFLMGQGVWLGSDELEWEDTLEEMVKQGTLTMGFIGLAECLKALIGEHHGESEYAQQLGLEIIGHMRQKMDEATEKYHLNFSLIATPAEGLSGRFTKIDKKIFGELEGITDREYYTNSFHIPVYYHIRAFDKIRLEAPYHALTNGGHISYVEVDGDPTNNLEAFEAVVRCMKENNIGYGSINHPVDRDPCCGYSGVIEGHICPKCGRDDSKSEYKFEKIRRITGYLVGTVDRFNDAKKAEEKERVKHD